MEFYLSRRSLGILERAKQMLQLHHVNYRQYICMENYMHQRIKKKLKSLKGNECPEN